MPSSPFLQGASSLLGWDLFKNHSFVFKERSKNTSGEYKELWFLPKGRREEKGLNIRPLAPPKAPAGNTALSRQRGRVPLALILTSYPPNPHILTPQPTGLKC